MNILNIVDKGGNIIGEETRENIHKKGLLHREVHVLFYTPNGEIIFQLRSKNKDTFPNKLDATVGGHVELNSDYIDTALKETQEETGLILKKENLKLIERLHKKVVDPVTKTTNNVLRGVFAYEHGVDADNLKAEDGESQGFEEWSIDKILNGLSEGETKKFIPTLLDEDYLRIYRKIKILQR
jgi:isopentenyldiphosphate isomerase